jgi:hypothetical protein
VRRGQKGGDGGHASDCTELAGAGVAAEGLTSGEQEELGPGGEGDAGGAVERNEGVSGTPESGELRQVHDAAARVGYDEGEASTIRERHGLDDTTPGKAPGSSAARRGPRS